MLGTDVFKSLYMVGGSINSFRHCGVTMEVYKKQNIYIPFDKTMTLLGTFWKDSNRTCDTEKGWEDDRLPIQYINVWNYQEILKFVKWK